MAKNDNLKDFLTDVADAIREKKGTTEKINPQDFSDEIRGIESGGGNPWNADVIWNDDTTFGFDSIKEIHIHEGITTLDEKAFRYNSSLQKVVLPKSLQIIGTYAFAGMAGILTEINLPENITTINNYAFNGSPFNKLIFPSKVTYINYGICTNCTSLESVVFLGNVTHIRPIAFQNCSALKKVVLDQCTKVPILENTNAFTKFHETCKLVVPDALYDQWIVATNWSTYASNIVKASEFVEPTNE